jgi:hypothetical protein
LLRPKEQNRSNGNIVEAADTAVEDEVLAVAMDAADAEVAADVAGVITLKAIRQTQIGM